MPKYAPAREDGAKPYMVEIVDWGKHRFKVVYATGVPDARFQAIGRGGPHIYVSKVRRATPDDVAELEETKP